MKEYCKTNNIEIDSTMLEFADGSIKELLNMAGEDVLKKYTTIQSVICGMNTKDKLKLIELFQEIDLKDRSTVEYLEFLLLKEGKYAKIQLIEDAKKALLANASEDMQKCKLVIELMK